MIAIVLIGLSNLHGSLSSVIDGDGFEIDFAIVPADRPNNRMHGPIAILFHLIMNKINSPLLNTKSISPDHLI
jgi:hypothetical protein